MLRSGNLPSANAFFWGERTTLRAARTIAKARPSGPFAISSTLRIETFRLPRSRLQRSSGQSRLAEGMVFRPCVAALISVVYESCKGVDKLV